MVSHDQGDVVLVLNLAISNFHNVESGETPLQPSRGLLQGQSLSECVSEDCIFVKLDVHLACAIFPRSRNDAQYNKLRKGMSWDIVALGLARDLV